MGSSGINAYYMGAPARSTEMFQILFDLEDYAGTYRETRDAYLKAANELKLATGPYKAARDAYVAHRHLHQVPLRVNVDPWSQIYSQKKKKKKKKKNPGFYPPLKKKKKKKKKK